MNISLYLKKSVLIAAFAFSVTLSNVHAYRVMASLNTYKKAKVTDAVNRVTELKADGLWYIANNSDFSDNEFRHIVNLMGGIRVTEDNPNSNFTYNKFVSVMGFKPNDVFCYNETGGTPGGTLLSNGQINTQSASHGNEPLICLTRAYVPGPWKNEVDRCLNNSKVEGIAWEPTRSAVMELTPGIHNGGPSLINQVNNSGKKLYILLHVGADGWSKSDNLHIINKLRSWAPTSFFNSNRLTLVYQNYDLTPNNVNTTGEWYDTNGSMESILEQAKSQPGYSGSGSSSSGGVNFQFNSSNAEGWARSSSIEAHAFTAQGEYLVRAAPNSDPFIFRNGLSFSGSNVTQIRVRMKAERAGPVQLFWGTTQAGSFSSARVKTVSYSNPYAYQELVFNMNGNSAWIGKTITNLRVDTTTGATSSHTWFDSIVGN